MRVVNITIECDNDEQAYYLEQHLRDNYIVKDCTFLPDSKDLYNTDPKYKEMYKKLKKDKTALYDYIKTKS